MISDPMFDKKTIFLSLFLSILLVLSYLVLIDSHSSGNYFSGFVIFSLIAFFSLLGVFSLYAHIRLVFTKQPEKKNSSDPLKDLINTPKYNQHISILENVNAKNKPEELILAVDGVKLYAKNPIDIALINNIYIKKVYGYTFQHPTVVMDIGANIAYSAIWFAREIWVKKVFAYEPVLPTYNQAKKSLDLNPNLAQKIIFHNFGLSNENTSLEIAYSKNHHTISSILLPKDNPKQKDNPPKDHVTIELRDVRNEMEEVIHYKNNSGSQLLMKIDCEGCEYKILDSFTEKIWDQIDVILMEIHGLDYEKILNLLMRNNFQVFHINHTNHKLFDHLCDIYAVKLARGS